MRNIQRSSAQALRNALWANALFSASSGLFILFAESTVVRWLGIADVGLWPIGAMLLVFAVGLAILATRPSIPVFTVKSVILSDWAWVVGTAVLLLMKSNAFSLPGIFLLVDVAVVVAVFAILQARGLSSALAAG